MAGKHRIDRARRTRRLLRRAMALVGVTGVALAVSVSTIASANATPTTGYRPETAPGYTNTYTPPESALNPQCPNAITATPGSDPASVALNGALNTASSFLTGGLIHYVYADNPHSASFDFTIQTCQVTYPANFFSSSDFDPTTGVLTSTAFSKQDLDSGGTPIDGVSVDGTSDSTSNIYFAWTVPSGLAPGTWVCNFARDIKDNHSGGGNRKATPTCVQVNTVADLTLCKVAGPNVKNGEVFHFAVKGPNGYAAKLPVAAGTCSTLHTVPFGAYTVLEAVPSPYEVQNISVDPSGAAVVVHRTAGKAIVNVGTGPVKVTYTNERFTCTKTGSGLNSSGIPFKEYTLVDPEGIVSISARQVHNASVNAAPFTVGTTGPVVVTVTRIDPNSPGHAIVFETNSSGVSHHCDPTV